MMPSSDTIAMKLQVNPASSLLLGWSFCHGHVDVTTQWVSTIKVHGVFGFRFGDLKRMELLGT